MRYLDREFEILMASDIVRDGMGLECWEVSPENRLVLEAFWRDTDGQFTFSAFEPDLPFELLEEFLLQARKRLPPSTKE